MDFSSVTDTINDNIKTAKEFMNKQYAVIFADDDTLIEGADNIVIHEITTEGLDLNVETTDEPIATRQYLRQHSVAKPMEFTISGYVYDRVLTKTDMEFINEALADSLGSVNAFLPNKVTGTALKYSNIVLQKYQQVRGYASKVIGGADSVLGCINKLRGNKTQDDETITHKVANELEHLANLCTAVDVNILDVKRTNLQIVSLHIDRETAKTKEKIGVTIGFREIPIVEDESLLCNTAKIQRATNTNLGKANGKTLTQEEVSNKKSSVLFKWLFG